MVGLSVVTAVVQLTSFVSSRDTGVLPWIGVNAAVGLTFYGLRRAAFAGREREASIALVVLYAGLTVMLLVTDGSDHPMWAMLSALTLALAATLLGGRGAQATVAAGVVVILPIVVLQETGALHPFVVEEGEDDTSIPTVVELLILLGVLAGIFRIYARGMLAGPPAPEATPLAQIRTLTLTPREVEVVRLIAEGHSNDAIARRLVVSPRTVHTHVTNAMRKSGCGNRTELGVLALREGLVPLTPLPEPSKARTP